MPLGEVQQEEGEGTTQVVSTQTGPVMTPVDPPTTTITAAVVVGVVVMEEVDMRATQEDTTTTETEEEQEEQEEGTTATVRETERGTERETERGLEIEVLVQRPEKEDLSRGHQGIEIAAAMAATIAVTTAEIMTATIREVVPMCPLPPSLVSFRLLLLLFLHLSLLLLSLCPSQPLNLCYRQDQQLQ